MDTATLPRDTAVQGLGGSFAKTKFAEGIDVAGDAASLVASGPLLRGTAWIAAVTLLAASFWMFDDSAARAAAGLAGVW